MSLAIIKALFNRAANFLVTEIQGGCFEVELTYHFNYGDEMELWPATEVIGTFKGIAVELIRDGGKRDSVQ